MEQTFIVTRIRVQGRLFEPEAGDASAASTRGRCRLALLLRDAVACVPMSAPEPGAGQFWRLPLAAQIAAEGLER